MLASRRFYMKYTVKCIYVDGVRLTETQIANTVSYTGRLIVEEPSLNDSLASYARRARLLDINRLPTYQDKIPPLFKAELSPLRSGQMIVNGFQIHIDEKTGEIHQHIQSWLLCSTSSK